MSEDPKLTVRFEADQQGSPKFVEAGSKRHYRVVLEVENPPADADAATFELDESYYDPNRTMQRDTDGNFRLKTTTYGDYALVVRIHRRAGPDLILKGGVARGLKQRYPSSAATDPVREAVSYIAAH
jgi:hypothetical protein